MRFPGGGGGGGPRNTMTLSFLEESKLQGNNVISCHI